MPANMPSIKERRDPPMLEEDPALAADPSYSSSIGSAIDVAEHADQAAHKPAADADYELGMLGGLFNAMSGAESLIRFTERKVTLALLSATPQQREQLDMQPIIDLMTRTKFAAEMDMAMVQALAQHMTFEQKSRSERVIKAGDVGNCFFIIVTGEAHVVKPDKNGNEQVVRTLGIGEAFGELALQIEGGRRSASVRTATDTEFLVLSGASYRSTLARVHTELIDSRVKMLRNLPAFSDCNPVTLKELAEILEPKRFSTGSFIFKQGDISDSMYFLTKGNVRMLRRMPVPQHVARMMQLDPMVARQLEPAREHKDRFVPLPEEIVTNGRPRSAHFSVLYSGRKQTSQLDAAHTQEPPAWQHEPPRPESSVSRQDAVQSARHGSREVKQQQQQQYQKHQGGASRRAASGSGSAQRRPQVMSRGLAMTDQLRSSKNGLFELTAEGRRARHAVSYKELHAAGLLYKDEVALLAQETTELRTREGVQLQILPESSDVVVGPPLATEMKQRGVTADQVPTTRRPTQSARPVLTGGSQMPTQQLQVARRPLSAACRPASEDTVKRTARQIPSGPTLARPARQDVVGQLGDRGTSAATARMASGKGQATLRPSGSINKGMHPSGAEGGVPHSLIFRRKVWVEFANVMAPDKFGESSLLGRGLRAGAALCGSMVEVLKLNKVDFDMKVDVNVGAVIQTVVANYPKDSKFISALEDQMKWEVFKKRLVHNILGAADKINRVCLYNEDFGIRRAWR